MFLLCSQGLVQGWAHIMVHYMFLEGERGTELARFAGTSLVLALKFPYPEKALRLG